MDKDILDKISFLVEKFGKINHIIYAQSKDIEENMIPDYDSNPNAVNELLEQMPEKDVREFIYKLSKTLDIIKYNVELCENNIRQLEREID